MLRDKYDNPLSKGDKIIIDIAEYDSEFVEGLHEIVGFRNGRFIVSLDPRSDSGHCGYGDVLDDGTEISSLGLKNLWWVNPRYSIKVGGSHA